MQYAVLQRLSQAGEKFTLGQFDPALLHTPFDQQRGTDVAIAIAAALRAVVAQTPRSIENAFTGLHLTAIPIAVACAVALIPLGR